MSPVVLGASALIPAIILLVFIYKKDKHDKEPAGLLAKCLILGGIISVIGALALEELLDYVINSAFAEHIYLKGNYYYGDTTFWNILYQAVYYVIGVGLVEEGCKFLPLLLFTRKNRNFNGLFDGIIYSVFVSLGFAAIENVKYVFMFEKAYSMGLDVALTRAYTAVPGHTFFGIIMGCFYSMWHMYKVAGKIEGSLVANGTVKLKGRPISSKKYGLLALLVPTLVHGAYDFNCSFARNKTEETVADILFYGLLIALYVLCFTLVRKYSRKDNADSVIAADIIAKKYPEYGSVIAKTVFTKEDVDNTLKYLATLPDAEKGNVGRQCVQRIVASAGQWYTQLLPILGASSSRLKNPPADIIAFIFGMASGQDGKQTHEELQYFSAIVPDQSYIEEYRALTAALTAMTPAERLSFSNRMYSIAFAVGGKRDILTLICCVASADREILPSEVRYLYSFTQL